MRQWPARLRTLVGSPTGNCHELYEIMRQFAEVHRVDFSFVRNVALFLLLITPAWLHASTVSGTVQDPSGAVVPGARIEITGSVLAQPIVLSSGALGKFVSPDLPAGTYTLRVAQDGFEPLVKVFDLHQSVELQLALTVAKQKVVASVAGSSLAFSNSDPVYRQLRAVGPGKTFRFDNFALALDTGTFQFRKGTLTILNPVNGIVTGAIFIGTGHFNLKPVTYLDERELIRRTAAAEVNEDFNEAVFRFTGEVRLKFMPGFGDQTEPSPTAALVLNRWRERMRHRREQALSFTQSLLEGENMDNVDADVLAAVYNPSHPEFLNAYLHGEKHRDLRFFLRTRVGAVPQINSPEEVALINYDPGGMEEGIWYLSHLKSEYLKHSASSAEDRRMFSTRRYKIETVIAKNGHLFCSATVSFESLIAGERVLKFGLLPNLRVSRVTDDQGRDIYFIQESHKEDGSFYAILPQAPPVGKEVSINVEYAGDKVLEEAGEGSYYVGARTSWYPYLNGFGEKASYDLIFKVPRKNKVVSIGKLQSESIEQDLSVTHWTTPVPVAVAGLNYGEYEKLELPDEITGYKISGYYLKTLPENLRGSRALQSMAPRGMTKYALEQARAQMQLCSLYFGKSPYEEIHISEQPNFNFGQSWPSLVYLPISAYTDSTQRWMLFGQINAKFSGFVQEVTPHEVAHQWWGHAVGWASCHDQWLSEGFAEFSAGLFLQKAVAGDWRKDYVEFWSRLHDRILEKNNYGIAPNDAGPLWMGERLISPRTENAYQNVTYPKGAFVLQMLRSMMRSNNAKDTDIAFIDMMHDFVDSHRERPATTESFKAIAEKHMTKIMDLQGNGRLDWFFDEWVYGTQIPRYHLEYQLSPADGGEVKLHVTLTQSEVDEHFAMLVPISADFGKGMVRIGQVGISGNSTRNVDVLLPAWPKKVVLNAAKEILER